MAFAGRADVPAIDRKSPRSSEWEAVHEQGLKDLAEGLRKLHQDEHTDLTIICGDLEIAVHKAVVCARSAFFRAACRKDTFKEGHEDTITLVSCYSGDGINDPAADDPEAIRLMVSYLYDMDYRAIPKLVDDTAKDPLPTSQDDDRRLTTHAKVFATAIKYGIASLDKLALLHFEEQLKSAEYDKCSISDIAETIRYIYTNAPVEYEALRKLMTMGLLSHPDLVHEAAIAEAVNSVDGLAWHLFVEAQKIALPSCWVESVGYKQVFTRRNRERKQRRLGA